MKACTYACARHVLRARQPRWCAQKFEKQITLHLPGVNVGKQLVGKNSRLYSRLFTPCFYPTVVCGCSGVPRPIANSCLQRRDLIKNKQL